jgi:hypothetical protein
MTMHTANAIMRAIPFLLLLTIASPGMAVDTDRQEDDIREAVFRHQFDHNASGLQKNAHAYCLAIRDGDMDSDPSDQLMKRFAHNKPPVRKASGCHWTSIQVIENRSGRSALIFFVSNVSWISEVEVAVEGG